MNQSTKFELVLFGSTGDLVTRKLLPSLYTAFINKTISSSCRIIALGRKEYTRKDYIKFVSAKFLDNNLSLENDLWIKFSELIFYLQVEANKSSDYIKLNQFLNKDIINIYYLSTAPDLFTIICTNLAINNLNHKNSRIILEKPIGNNLKSSREINEHVKKIFREEQIFRIDHYLGKESVQNLMAIRFGNSIFEAFWNRQWISSIQITIAEKIGVSSRGGFYNQIGALRDMLQNHLLQLLCIVAMESPISMDADVIRKEKLKVLQSLKPFNKATLNNYVVRGQYQEGLIDGQKVCGFLSEENIPQDSTTETYVALKTEVQNWRWSGVPFYLRTGKRLETHNAEIVIFFKELPIKIFPNKISNFSNRMVIKLQPDDEIKLYFLSKEPGEENNLKPVFLDLNFTKVANKRIMEGYERLLIEIIKGRLELFLSQEEQEVAWKWVEPILDKWKNSKEKPEQYISGSRGPFSGDTLLEKGFLWHEQII